MTIKDDEPSVGDSTPAPRYRLVAIDVDGTLLSRGRGISRAVVEAIQAARARGVVVTLASGRMFPLVRPLVDELGLDAPVICYGGAMVVDPLTRAVVFRRGVPAELAAEVIRAARERSLSARIYQDDRVLVERLDPGAFNYESLRRVHAELIPDLLAALDVDPSHLAIDAPPERTRDLVVELRGRFAPRLNVTTGHPLLTEFSHPEVHKGSALDWIARRLGIPREQVLAIGDDWNDLEMLRTAGLGVAVANAHPDVLAAADAIVPGVDQDGVAIALQRFVLENGPER